MLASRFYLDDAFGTPPNIFRAESVLHTQKLCNVSAITHACVHACSHICMPMLFENPLLKKLRCGSLSRLPSHLSSSRNAASKRSFLFSHRIQFSPLFIFLFHISTLIKENVYRHSNADGNSR